MSKAGVLSFASLALLIAVAATAAFAQGAHSLQGKVMFANGSVPATPVKVTLTFNGRTIYETFTDLSGRFSFSGLHRGMYQLIAEGNGQTFETTRVSAEVSAYGAAPQTFTQNIQLRLKADKPLPATSGSIDALDVNVPAQARSAYEKGIREAGNSKPEKAIKYFQEAITAYPQYYPAYVALAEQYDKLKRDTQALDAYQQAIDLQPDRAPAYVGLGVMFVKQKRYSEALAPLRRSLDIDKQSSAPFMFLGLAEMMTGDYQSSEANLLRAYEIGKPALVRIYLANLYDLKGEPAKAIDQLKAFLKESPNLSEARQIEIREVIEKLKRQLNKR